MSTARISRISRSPLSYVALLGLAACCDAVVSKSGLCIVGAGPGGVQLGQYLSMSRSSDLHDYVIFERAARAGEFFRRYPVHRELISINKRFHSPGLHWEAGFRQDWNSLIGRPEVAPMTNRSEDFFPKAPTSLRVPETAPIPDAKPLCL